MGQTEQSFHYWDEEQKKNFKNLHTAIERLSSVSLPPKEVSGLTQNFLQKIKSEQAALKLCEEAMRTLSREYVQHMESFQQTTSAIKALDSLERAEELWDKEAEIIKELDGEGNEIKFLHNIRELAFHVIEKKLNVTLDSQLQKSSVQTKALCLAMIGVMNKIFDELNIEPIDDRQRQSLLEIAKKLL
ncbi:hypothetical protein JYU14_03940 [Simkania negevensis]|uniref:Uncharacterized protein n=1 Tax=Simkania negevensis TaxID=83561 RepID=A0ABS3AR51_9BACT|nr:hypothetical protein [Simkania negevensis]